MVQKLHNKKCAVVRTLAARRFSQRRSCAGGEGKSREGQVKRKGRLLFVNKKKQKNFFMPGRGLVADNAHAPA
jgi:hypothetical protein